MVLICKNGRSMEKYVYSESVFNTLHIEIKHKCKKNFFGQNKRYKNALFFLLRAPTHHSFTFNLRFLYELKYKVRLLKLYVGFFIFDSVAFLLKFMFCSTKCMGSLTLKRHNSFQN